MGQQKSSYRRKKEAGLCGHSYDTGSKFFNAGAWKNLSSDEYKRNHRALYGE